jgi:hypothetical protein
MGVVRGRTSRPVITATVIVLASLLVTAGYPILAAEKIPETSGFSGFVLFGVGAFNVESNLIVAGPPLAGDVGNDRIDSIFDRPSSQSAAATPLVGEFNYTFAKTRTQLFLGNRLEDILRLDVAFGLGVRQELPGDSILALSVLGTPLEMKVWSDPYVEGEDRVETKRDKPGARLRWERIFKTGLQFTATYRQFQHDQERSGDWLIDEARLNPAEQPLLNRNGDVSILQLLYRIKVAKVHVFEPAVRYQKDNLDGAAMRNDGYALALTYLYLTPKLVLDVNLLYRDLGSDATHPVYDEVLEGKRYGVGFTAFYDLFKKPGWRAWAGAEYFREDTSIEFFDAKASSVMFGAIWRHARK